MFNWGFIGSGSICYTTSKELLKNKNHKIIGVYSHTFSHCKKFADKVGATPYKNIEDLLNNKKIDAIYIATPHALHFKYANLALEHKIPVLVEKAFTLSYKSSLKLIEIAKANNTYICEAMWTWFANSSLKVKEWIENNQVGRPILMKSNFNIFNLLNPKNRVINNNLGGGSLLDLGVYPIAYAYNLFGYPDEIKAKAKLKNDVDYNCKIQFKYKNGLVCNLESAIDHIGSCSTIIIGEKGRIKIPFPMHHSKKAFLSNGKKVKYIDDYKFGLYENEFNLVSQEIKQEKKESNFIPFKSTLDIMRIIDEIKQQIGLTYKDETI